VPNKYATDPVSRGVGWLRQPKSKARECAEIFAVAAVSTFLLRAYVVEARFIPSRSMLPTMHVDDRLLIEKVSQRFRAPRRGEIVVFGAPAAAKDIDNALIKRVIGLPGETVSIHDGRVWINDRPLKEPYLKEPPRYPEPDWAALGMPHGVVPAGHLFMMGDNRNNSQDSHVFGPVPVRNVIGHPVLRFWPPARIAWVR